MDFFVLSLKKETEEQHACLPTFAQSSSRRFLPRSVFRLQLSAVFNNRVFLSLTPSTVQPSNPLMSLRIPASFTTVSFDNDHNVYACIGRCERNARSACLKAAHIGSTTRCIAYSERRRSTYWWMRWLVLWVGPLRPCCGCLCGCRTRRGGLGGDEAW